MTPTPPSDPPFGDAEERPIEPGPLPLADLWGWTGELPPTELRTVAPVSFELWRRGAQWVNRRVQTIELLDVDTVRLRHSIDFRIPTKLPGAVRLGGKDIFFLPVAVLPRRTSLAYFDICDESGTAVPILTRQENSRLTGAMLTTAARRALARVPRAPDAANLELSDALIAYLASIPTKTSSASKPFVGPVLDPANTLIYPDPAVADALLSDEDFRDLLGLSASCSFVHVPLVAKAGERRIIKLSFYSPWDSRSSDRDVSFGDRFRQLGTWLGWSPETRYLIMPQVGNAESFHAQIDTPGRVEFTEAGMRNRRPADLVRPLASTAPALPEPPADDPNDAKGYQQFVGGIDERKHVYVESAHAHRAGFIWVRFRVVRHGFLRAAVAVAWLTTLLLVLFADRGENVLGEAQTAAALLLLVPALIAGFLIAPGEHAMTRYLLRGPRFLTACSGLLALLAIAALLTLPAAEPSPAVPEALLWIWRGEAMIGVVLSVLLTISLRRPKAGTREEVSPPVEAQQPFDDLDSWDQGDEVAP
jgi:hypothetical protein